MSQKQPAQKQKTPLIERVEHRQTLLNRIDEIKGYEIGKASEVTDALWRSVGDAEAKSKAYIRSLGGEDSIVNWAEAEKGQLAQLRESEKKASTAHEEARARFLHLTDELNALENDCRQTLESTSADEIIQHQNSIADAETEVQKIESLIDKQHEAIRKAGENCLSGSELQQDREDLLATIAIGMSQKDESEALDKIASLDEQADTIRKASLDFNRITDAGKQTLRGLQRRLVAAQSYLDELNGQTNEVGIHYLTSEANKCCEGYIQHASKLVGIYERLESLNHMLKASGNDFLIGNEMKLPLFRLQSCKSQTEHPSGSEYYFQSIFFDVHRKAMSTEKKRFQALGITIF